MQRRTLVAMATLATASSALVAPLRTAAHTDTGKAVPKTGSPLGSGFAPVNGLELYYEIHGSGEPLILLHGAFGAVDLWGRFCPPWPRPTRSSPSSSRVMATPPTLPVPSASSNGRTTLPP